MVALVTPWLGGRFFLLVGSSTRAPMSSSFGQAGGTVAGGPGAGICWATLSGLAVSYVSGIQSGLRSPSLGDGLRLVSASTSRFLLRALCVLGLGFELAFFLGTGIITGAQPGRPCPPAGHAAGWVAGFRAALRHAGPHHRDPAGYRGSVLIAPCPAARGRERRLGFLECLRGCFSSALGLGQAETSFSVCPRSTTEFPDRHPAGPHLAQLFPGAPPAHPSFGWFSAFRSRSSELFCRGALALSGS